MAEVVEKAAHDDPEALRRRIAELERELARVRAGRSEPRVDLVEVEIPVLDEALTARLEATIAPLFGGPAACAAAGPVRARRRP
jgi:hypothetical protein